jgi:uncharacterized protein involved in type VI secretion and phage assembly
MKLTFKINGEKPDPFFGVVEGYVLEGINQVSQIELILVSEFDLCDEDCAAYIGGSVTIALSDTVEGELSWSRFDGIIYEFHVLTLAGDNDTFVKYQMIVRPKLWELNFRVQSRSFSDKTKVEVIDQVFKEWNLIKGQEYEICLFKQNGSHYPKMTQVIQNQISDLVFVQNLMREAGINFHFVADKKDAKRDTLWLVDHNGFFDEPFKKIFGEKKAVPYKPHAGMPCSDFKFRIESLERQFRATIMDTVAYANFGDGIKDAFESDLTSVDKGYAGLMASYGSGGESKEIANREAIKRADYLKSNQVTYEGRSNFFLFRPGEKYPIGDGCGKPRTNKLNILLTSVCHHFHQTVQSAFTGDQDLEYENLFFAVNKEAPYRPDQTLGRSIMEMKRSFTNRHSACASDPTEDAGPSEIESVESYDLRKRITELKQELAIARDLSGVMVGEVIKGAWVSSRNELLCRIKNERFPEGLTIKVALGWLDLNGWLSLLPRIGMQVYFQFLNGEGGQNEAIMVGYRSNENMPIMDPHKTTDCITLVKGDEPVYENVTDNVVKTAKFSPENNRRNSLSGELGVAEVAVIDGPEKSIYLHANNRICVVGDNQVNIKAGALNESAGDVSQQYGSLCRGVSGDEKVSIKDNVERTVGGSTKEHVVSNETTFIGGNTVKNVDGTSTEFVKKDISILSSDGNVEMAAKSKLLFHNEMKSKCLISDDSVLVGASKDSEMNMNPEQLTLKSGKVEMHFTKDTDAILSIDESAFCVSGGGVSASSGDTQFYIKKNGNIGGQSKGMIALQADKKIDLIADKAIFLSGSGGATIVLEDGEIKLNCGA